MGKTTLGKRPIGKRLKITQLLDDPSISASRSQLVGEHTDFSSFKWKVGQRFTKRKHVKDAVAKYAIYQGWNVSFTTSNKNRQGRLGITCLPGCKWSLDFALNGKRTAYVVKRVVGEHTCMRNVEKNRQLKASWLDARCV